MKKMIRALEDVFPIYKIENDCILSRQGDLTLAFEVELPEIFTLSTEDFEGMQQAWVKAIKLLPNHTIVHKQDWFTESNFLSDFEKDNNSFLSRSSDKHFFERAYLEHRCFLYLSKKAPNRKSGNALLSSLIKPTLSGIQTVDLKMMDQFLEKAGQFGRVLEDSGFIRLKRMTTDQLASTETSSGLLEQYCYLLHHQQPPVIRDIQIGDEIKIGDLHCQVFSLADVQDLPSLCGPRISYEKYSTDRTRFSIGFAAPIGQLLDCNHIYNQVLVVDDAQATLKKLESKRLRLHSLSTYSRENSISRDATNSFLNEAIAKGQLPVKAHFNILTWTAEKEKAKDLKNKVSAALAQMDARAKQETASAAQLFWACLPGNEADIASNELFDIFAEQATCFFNAETNYRNSISPVGIRLAERISGIPVHVDISDEPVAKGICTNRNKFILGPSGSGKSFFTNHMVRTYYEQGTHVVLVDVGHSYKGLCDMVGGYYFTYSEKDPIRFNPFFIGERDTLDIEKKESIKTLLLALWKKENESFMRSEYVALSNALQGYFDKLDRVPGIFPCFNTFYEYLQGDFLEVLKKDKVKEKDFDIDNFLFVLRPFYQGGEYDYLLNATKNLDVLQQRFLVFELDNIKDNATLLPVTTLMVMEIFISKMRKLKGVRKMILIEEAWKAIMRQGMAEYIKYLFKTVRKFYGEAIVVTQEVDDIISSPIIKDTIINNSDCKILLDQTKYVNKFDQIQELLGLTDREKALVLSMNKANDTTKKYKEVFISLGGVISKVYRTEVSLEEYLCYTTEEKEKIKVQAYAAKYGSIDKGIQMLSNHMRQAG